MSSDKFHYNLCTFFPEFMLTVMKQEHADVYSGHCETIKDVDASIDFVFKPRVDGLPNIITEIQFYEDPKIYDRTAKEMRQYRIVHGDVPVKGLIAFKNRSLDPGTVLEIPSIDAGFMDIVHLDEELPKQEKSALSNILAFTVYNYNADKILIPETRELVDLESDEILKALYKELFRKVLMLKYSKLSKEELMKYMMQEFKWDARDVANTQFMKDYAKELLELGKAEGKVEANINNILILHELKWKAHDIAKNFKYPLDFVNDVIAGKIKA